MPHKGQKYSTFYQQAVVVSSCPPDLPQAALTHTYNKEDGGLFQPVDLGHADLS